MYSYEFDCYERAVRSEGHSQDFYIINCYVHLGLTHGKQLRTALSTKHLYMRMISTLEESMCDPLLSYKWRSHCYRVMKQLMPVVFEMMNSQDYAALLSKITTLSHYFLQCDVKISPPINYQTKE